MRQAVLKVLNQPWDLERAAGRHAFRTSAELVATSMPLARVFRTPFAVLDHALAAAPPTGLVAEFGVHSGSTLRRIARARSGAHGFDSFQGLPEDWRPSHPRGTFALSTLPSVGDAELHVGWFEETLPPFLEGNDQPAALLHLDADLYSSTATVLTALANRIRPGTVLLFDEYLNYPGWEQHEHRAFTEYVEHTGVRFDYIAYNSRGQQVAVQIR
ncbi:class I SAM-dependent methyltransferase [Geodermatophilus sp. URMC 63]